MEGAGGGSLWSAAGREKEGELATPFLAEMTLVIVGLALNPLT